MEETPGNMIWHYKSARFPVGEKLMFVSRSGEDVEKRFVDTDGDIDDLTSFIHLNRIYKENEIPRITEYYVEVLTDETYDEEIKLIRSDLDKKRSACSQLYKSLGWSQADIYSKCSQYSSEREKTLESMHVRRRW
jgi:superfamily I DNA and RNA helicase